MGIEIPRNRPVPRSFADSAEDSIRRVRDLLLEKRTREAAPLAGATEEAVSILRALGYKKAEAERAVAVLIANRALPAGADSQTIAREVLKRRK